MAELEGDLVKHFQHIDNIGHEAPVPLLDLGQNLVVVSVLCSSLHIHQGLLQDNKSFEHEEGGVPAGGYILPEEMENQKIAKLRLPT